jgi:hypothetical protein
MGVYETGASSAGVHPRVKVLLRFVLQSRQEALHKGGILASDANVAACPASRLRSLTLLAALSAVALQTSSYAHPRNSFGKLPTLMLWAWERPEDLRAVDPAAGIAFLAQTITINFDHLRVNSRRHPLRVADRAVLVAVTRIEFPTTRTVDAGDEERIAAAIAETASFPRVAGVQVDFDAVESQRPFYRRLLGRLRARRGWRAHVDHGTGVVVCWGSVARGSAD